MKIARFQIGDAVHYGSVEGDSLRVLQGDPFEGLTETGTTVFAAEVRLLTPVIPRQILCVGLNYLAHVLEFHAERTNVDPVIFMAAPSALLAPGEAIRLPDNGHLFHQEAELVAVIGKRAKDVPEDQALDYVLGYTAGNDVSDRTIQRADGQWTRSKSFPTFKPLGPYLVTDLDVSNLGVRSRINGKIAQDSDTAHMIHPVARLVSFLSGFMTLEPGDVVYTGTPGGPGEIKPGDVCEIEVEGIGVLQNPVL